MRIDVLTLFPDAFDGFVGSSIVGRARTSGIVDIAFTDIRDFAKDSIARSMTGRLAEDRVWS